MPSVKDIDPNRLIAAAAAKLQELPELAPPAWAPYAKTGVHKQRAPEQANWWFLRSAALLRTLALGRTVGVSRLRTRYGGRKNRGHKPEHRFRGSGAVIRTSLQQLEAAGFVRTEKGKGRSITPKGLSFLAKAAKVKQ